MRSVARAVDRSRFCNGCAIACLIALLGPAVAVAQEPVARAFSPARSFLDMLRGADFLGMANLVLLFLVSVALVALLMQQFLIVRRRVLVPPGLAEAVYRLVKQGNVAQAEQQCRLHPSFLGYVLLAGLAELRLGYAAVEKAVEDALAEQSARLMRKIEYLSVVGNIGPLLGLLGTVWGLLLAFGHLPQTQVANRAEGLAYDINLAIWTTVLGLWIAIPALTAFAYFRGRVDHYSAEVTLLAEHVFARFKRVRSTARKVAGGKEPSAVSDQPSA